MLGPHIMADHQMVKSALIFTMDGSEMDFIATVTTVDENGKWKRIASTHARSSRGIVLIPLFLGMKILEHEYKVIGLIIC